MFSEILKIIPKLDDADMKRMESVLNGRFAKVAKKFGGGIMSVLKGGGIAGIAIGLIDKVLNPLQEVQEALEKTLNHNDDLATYAKQFNTSAGTLAKLQAYGTAFGLDADGLRMLLVKFQGAVANQAKNPGELTSVANYVGKKDTAEAFFEFVQALQKLTPIQQSLVQQEVFGERQILKASEFLQGNFKQFQKYADQVDSEELTHAIEHIADMKGMEQRSDAMRDLKDPIKKAPLIQPQTMLDLAKGKDVELARENTRLASYDDLKKISMATDKMVKVIEDGYLKLAPYIAEYLPLLIDEIIKVRSVLDASRALKGLTPGQSGKDK